jgi:hypothetical protein
VTLQVRSKRECLEDAEGAFILEQKDAKRIRCTILLRKLVSRSRSAAIVIQQT